MPFPALYPTPVAGVTGMPAPGHETGQPQYNHLQYGPMLTYIMPPALLARAVNAQGGIASASSSQIDPQAPLAPPASAQPYHSLETPSAIKARAQAAAALAAARGAGGLRDRELPLGRFRLPGLEQVWTVEIWNLKLSRFKSTVNFESNE